LAEAAKSPDGSSPASGSAFACPSCGKRLKVRSGLAGKRARCPHCKAAVRVPPEPATGGEANQPEGDAASAPTLPPEPQSFRDTQDHVEALKAPPTAWYQPGDKDWELCQFLTPPQAADELGRLGPYRILALLGTGGMGVVFRAEDPQLNRLVALKAMRPGTAGSASGRQRFLREARAAAAIKHDHIVAVYQVGEDRGIPFLAMEFLEGEPLDRRLRREGKLPLLEVLRFGRQIALGLAAAHKRGLIHRDIKPANLWLEKETGRIKVLDFGLARAAREEAPLTQSGAIVGTPEYMAPEQVQGKDLDERCDLFSLGCVLYRMSTGQMPFKGADMISTLMAVATEDPPAPRDLEPGLSAGLSKLILRLLAKDPSKRPESAQAVAEALRELEERIEEGRDTAGPKTARLRTEQPRKKTLLGPWLIGMAGGLAALGVVAIAFSWPTPRGPVKTEGKDAQVIAAGELPAVAAVAPEPAGPLPQTFTNKLGMEFVLVPRGAFLAGGGGGRPGEVQMVIPHDFYLGKYEVTQEEWEKITGFNPSHFSRTGGKAPGRADLPGREMVKDITDEDLKRFPVENVSWEAAQLFLQILNERDRQAGWLYRLPKEAEWEYACRGGPTASKLDYGYDFYLDKPMAQLSSAQANIWQGDGNWLKRTCKVGSYQPNRLGLFDMHGNVCEWCDDYLEAADGTARRVIRGGCWHYASGDNKAVRRSVDPPTFRLFDCGLRVARIPVGSDSGAPQAVELSKKRSNDYDDLAAGRWIAALPSQEEFERLRAQKSYTGQEPRFDRDTLDIKGQLKFPTIEGKNMLLRARVKKLSPPGAGGPRNVGLLLRCSDAGGCGVWFNGGGQFGIGLGGRAYPWKNLVMCQLAENHDGFFEFAFAAIDDRLTAYVNGRKILETRDPASLYQAGIVRVGGEGLFQNIEVQLLDPLR
jgi:formylglycine-generating enzyme required for sulfatase activity